MNPRSPESRRDPNPITAWFVVRMQPYGSAPGYIKDQWIDVPLPLRYDRPAEGPEPHLGADITHSRFEVTEDGVTIETADAVKALKLFGRDEAAQWWEDWATDMYGRVEGGLIFNSYEGQLVPTDYLQRLLPGIEEFDQIQA